MDRHIKQNLTGQSHSEWDMPSKPFLTIGEVANLLQVSNRTVYNLIYKGTTQSLQDNVSHYANHQRGFLLDD